MPRWVTRAPRQDWRCTAAYLYLLQLDSTALAWEYLRRNAGYRTESLAATRRASPAATRFGLTAFEDPNLDARDARPLWELRTKPHVRLVVEPDPSPCAARFSLWRLPGTKRLLHDGVDLLLTLALASEVIQVGLGPAVEHGSAMAFLFAVVTQRTTPWRAAERFGLLLSRTRPANHPAPRRRVTRSAIVHMRSLQALDGHAAGASHRDIAAAIFGAECAASRWHADSELRGRVRHLLQRGDQFVHAGYRDLVTRSAG